MKRILTALVALPILLYTVWNEIPYFFVAIGAAAVVIGLFEFYKLASRAGVRPVAAVGYVAAIAVVAAYVYENFALMAAALGAAAVAALTVEVLRAEDMQKSLASVSATLFGVVYIALLLGSLVAVRMTPDALTAPATPKLAAKLLTMFFAMVMMTDTGAYYTGRSIGRHKLAPRVSPGKTIEGSAGGFISAALAGLASKYIFFPEIPALHALLLGAVIGVFGQVGDLAESLLKRGSGVKDSGNIFPGHGGMLDRVDSLIFCAPLIYCYSRLLFPKS